MFYTGVDPLTMKEIYVPKSKREKAMQRALLQYRNPKKYDIVYEALVEAGREDLIGNGPKCLIRPKTQGKKFNHGGNYSRHKKVGKEHSNSKTVLPRGSHGRTSLERKKGKNTSTNKRKSMKKTRQ